MSQRQILVTSALPYANGSIHIGHLVEYIQTDIWVRFQKMRAHVCHYVCADDTHGTPVMLRAEAEGISPESLIERMHGEHSRDFEGFMVDFDEYYSTHSPETQHYANLIYKQLQDADLIDKRDVEQFYDPQRQMFLPDRYIKGECPRCASSDQYGDNCEACGAAYTPGELKNPRSVVSGAEPVLRSSEHYFFRLSDPRCEKFLRQYTNSGVLQSEAANKMREWLGEGGEAKLGDWDISRDEPYFGFEIPGAPGKFFYVWLDAPVGYMGAFAKLCADHGLDFDAFWRDEATHSHNNEEIAEIYHFIGKDILYFHALFWPAQLHFSGFRTPSGIFAHGFLTVGGAKMSKSRGTFITAKSYLDQGLNPQWLRYYYATKLSASMEDIDLSLQDFVNRVNSDLIGKYINIASRAAGFINKRFAGKLAAGQIDLPAVLAIREQSAQVAEHYEAREYGKAMREIMSLADQANQYVDQVKPWEIAKQPGHEEEVHAACSNAINLFRLLTILLKPVLPGVAHEAESFMQIPPLLWEDINRLLPQGHSISSYEHLMGRIEMAQVEALVAANRQT